MLKTTKQRSNVVSLPTRPRRAASSATRVHDKKIVCADVVPLPVRLSNDGRPMLLRDAPALPPLQGTPVTHTDGGGHVSNGIPAVEKLIQRLHTPYVSLDSLSSPEQTSHPVTHSSAPRTMCPMGKATTPTVFKREFCERLQAARTLARLEQADVARELGIPANTYSKYESRSLPPHHLIPRIAKILGVSLETLYGEPEIGADTVQSEKGEGRPRSRARA